MKRNFLLIILAIVLTFCLAACACEHEWEEATCIAPKTCKLCKATEGEVADHHRWQDATCVAPRTCPDCGITEGEALGHTWVDATCTDAKTCTVCSEKEDEPLGHKNSYWKTQKKSTCSELGSETSVCNVCKETVTRDIPMKEHKPGKWQVHVHATLTTPGLEVQTCTVCEQWLEGRNYDLPPFDTKVLKGKSNFKYDEFSKSWKYYKTYTKNWSDATENITIILFSEENGNNIEDIELRASLRWKDAAQEIWPVKTVEILVGDKIYLCEMTTKEDDPLAYTFLASETSYQMIQDIAASNKVKAKITYTNGNSQELPVGSALKSICSDIVKYDMWYYYTPGSLLDYDTTTVR